jgi:hypothetical protein
MLWIEENHVMSPNLRQHPVNRNSWVLCVARCSPDFGGPGGDSHRILSSNVLAKIGFSKIRNIFQGFFYNFFGLFFYEKPFAKIRFYGRSIGFTVLCTNEYWHEKHKNMKT